MQKFVFAVALCAVLSIGMTSAAQAGEGLLVASPVLMAEEKGTTEQKGTVERCLKWVKQVIQEKVGNKIQTRTVTTCAVRG